jgi:hypothetical protein
MCVSIFSTTFVWHIFHSKEIWARYDQKKYIGHHVMHTQFFLILMKLHSAWQLFEKYSNIILQENRSSETELLHVDRRMDGQTWRS